MREYKKFTLQELKEELTRLERLRNEYKAFKEEINLDLQKLVILKNDLKNIRDKTVLKSLVHQEESAEKARSYYKKQIDLVDKHIRDVKICIKKLK